MTSQDILKRYDMTVDNKFIVHANIPSYTALFENYDHTSSFYKRDINEKLAEYLMECALEIGTRNDFVIRFDLPEEKKSETEEADIVTAFKNYFDYMISLSRKEIGSALKRLIIHLGIACAGFVLWFLSTPGVASATKYKNGMLAIGLVAAIWVLVLTGLSRFIFRVQSQLGQTRLLKKLKSRPIQFNYIAKGGPK